MGLAEVASAAPSSAATSKTAGGKPKVKLGKNIIEDYKTVSIGQSAYFTGEPPPRPYCVHLVCRRT